MTPKTPLKTRDDLSMAYTPGVARICSAIAERPELVWDLTVKQNAVAVVTDGTAVLGLGDIGPEAALPVMEGKAMLFKEFGGVDAWPLCLATKDVDEIVAAVAAVAPGFGGINLEDISAPRCFEIEERLRERLEIPVFHDDQHGPRSSSSPPSSTPSAWSEAARGRQGRARRRRRRGHGDHEDPARRVRRLIGCDLAGAIHRGPAGLEPRLAEYAELTNPGRAGTADDVLAGADVFIGVSGPGRRRRRSAGWPRARSCSRWRTPPRRCTRRRSTTSPP